MLPNLQETADLVTFTEGILTGKIHFLYSKGSKSCLLSVKIYISYKYERLDKMI